MKKDFIEILNENIYYILEDTGKDKVLFLHGFGSSVTFANQVYSLENRDYDVIAFDFPGCGQSSENQEITIERYQEIALEFVKKINFKIKLVVGHSLGGASALYLLNHNVVDYALLAAPINYNLLTLSHLKEGILNISNRIKRWLLPNNIDDAYESQDNLVYTNVNKYKDNLKRISTIFLNFMTNKKNIYSKMVKEQITNNKYLKKEIFDLYDQNQNYEFIIGMNDMFVPNLTVYEIADKRNKNLTILENCGHALFFEKPKEVNNKINFLISK
ncbi:alpha/beta fold hydrolase [[Mycoplasma] collis]|uniref:alpha/beta fold hydrolase n=1 Tax=[Mycoplasma] collis TaxID=2127 RepID=UPI00051C1C0D|nr:alpha/beta hydrolase [[Mycoplasma] collis]